MSSISNKLDKFTDDMDNRKLKRMKRKEKFSESLVMTLQTTTKQLIWWFTVNGTIWIYMSYVLAFTEHTQIAETLSSNVCTVVIGSMGMYVISKTIENVFKYNTLGGVSNQKALEREGTADPGIVTSADGIPVIDMTDGIETNGNPESVIPDPIIPDPIIPDPVIPDPVIPTPPGPIDPLIYVDPNILN